MGAASALVLLFAIGACVAAIRPRPDGLAPATSGSAITFGDARITLLTEQLFRFEYSSTGIFDDRATLSVVNRALPKPSFKTSNPNSNEIEISIGSATIIYTDAAQPSRTCAASVQNTDAVNPTRAALWPNGAYATTYEAHLDTRYLRSFVWDTQNDTTNCWPLCSLQGNYTNKQRVLTMVNGAANGQCTPTNAFAGNLQIVSTDSATPFKWTPGVVSTGNLLGTYSSLDCYSTPMQCYEQYMTALSTSPGLLSTQGWAVFDDTITARFVASPKGAEYPDMLWWTQSNLTDSSDFYFLAHGLNFKQALYDFSSISGQIALPPRAAFGPWWSRYYPYTAQTIVSEVLSGYANYSIPLTTLVLDMDWHDEPTTGGCQSWGNYDWNLSYFPDPTAFEQYVHSSSNVVGYPLHMSLNVHPQTGVDHCDERYAQIAIRMGVDPATNQTIPCNFANVTFTQAVFDTYFDAMPLRLNDVWWTDYGGCGGPNPLLWSNYVFDSYPGAIAGNRPLVLSRNGGMGNQRYPIGFSGDTFQHEITLDFEIQTTPMAANALFGYWSHDIGGFHNGTGCVGDADPTNYTGSELFMRWVQFGSVSPIMRTHCDHCERRIWMFYFHFPLLLDAFRLRNSLVPYLYTEAYQSYQTGVAIVHPTYVEWPSYAQAYTATHQYYFGRHIIAAPISSMVSPATNTTLKSVWLPPGNWSTWDGTQVQTGPVWYNTSYTQAQIPLFVPAGQLLAFKGGEVSDFQSVAPGLVWTLWPGGSSGTYSVYEDDGDSTEYENSAGATTTCSYSVTSSRTNFTISPTSGVFASQPVSRMHTIQIRNWGATLPSGVTLNGKTLPSSAISIVSASEAGLSATADALVLELGSMLIIEEVSVVVSK